MDTSTRRVEDWVSRTRGLHLDSPLLTAGDATAFFSNAPSEAGNDDGDMIMVLLARPAYLNRITLNSFMQGPEDFDTSTNISLFVTPPANTHPHSYSHFDTRHSNSSSSVDLHAPPGTPPPNRGSLAPPILSLQTDHLTPSTNPQVGPHIHILPATPSSRHAGSSAPPSPMAISPGGSSVWSPSSPNSRRAKLTMGPRTDCPKCREGVKGHWMHYD